MPKTRQQLAARGHNTTEDHEMEDPVEEETNSRSRRAFGDVSNRGRNRSSKTKGRAGATRRNENPAEEVPARRSSRGRATTRTNDITVLEEDTAADPDPPKRRRSTRSCVLNQRANNSDESNQANESKVPSKATTKKAKAKGSTQTKSRAAKRRREESDDEQDKEAEPKREAKKQKGTSSREKKSTAKKASKSSRKRSSSRGSRKKSPPRKPSPEFLTETNYELVREPFDSSKFTLGIAPHDKANKDDVNEVSNYTTDIFQRLYYAETAARPHLYMADQTEITPAMRAILIDWLVEVHMKFRLVPPTMHLCVNIIDRFLSTTRVERRKLQLVGVTALLVACKYEEIYPPEVRDCVYITDRTYTRQEVLDMEQDIVRKLEFKMTVPTAHPFLERFLLITKASPLVTSAANYYLERSLQEYQFLKYRPSLIAAAAVCLALNNPDIRDEDDVAPAHLPGIPEELLDYTGFDVSEIRECATLMAEKVSGDGTSSSNNKRHLVAVKRKYASSKFHAVSQEYEDPIMDHLFDE